MPSPFPPAKPPTPHYASGWRPRKVTPSPGPLSQALRAGAARVLNAGTHDQTLAEFVQAGKGYGVITDVDGNEYVDGISAWGAEPWGASRAEIRDALLHAWDTHGAQLSCSVLTPPAIELAERLTALAPASITRAEFSVTGTQAVESTVRLMRAATGRSVILVFGPVYHGESTYLTAAMSSDTTHASRGAHAYAPGILHIPYPCQPLSPFRSGEVGNEVDVLHYLDWTVSHQVAPDQIAGVLIEPISTEGGVIAPTQEFWDGLADRCRQHGWLLAVDEVQTGIGRCGTPLAINWWDGIEPDLVILGKGLSGGGMPIAAILGSERVMSASALSQGSTFGWQPAACAAALAGLDIMMRPGTLEHARWLGEEALRAMGHLDISSGVTGVRSYGAEVAVGFTARSAHEGSRGARIHQFLLDHGVLAMIDYDKPFVRLQPALTLDPVLWRYALDTLVSALSED